MMTNTEIDNTIKTAILEYEKTELERLDALKKREQDLRHDLRKDFGRLFSVQDNKIEKLHDETAELKHEIKTMTEFKYEIKKDMKDGVKEIKQSIDNLPNIFVSKEEHNSHKEKTDLLIRVIWTIGVAAFIGLGGFVWSLITNLITNAK